MYKCINAYMRIWIYVYTCIWYMYTCICVYMYICVCVCIHLCIYLYMCICIYVYMYICIYVYTYIYVYPYVGSLLGTQGVLRSATLVWLRFSLCAAPCSFDWQKKCVRLSAGALTATFRAILRRFWLARTLPRVDFRGSGLRFSIDFSIALLFVILI